MAIVICKNRWRLIFSTTLCFTANFLPLAVCWEGVTRYKTITGNSCVTPCRKYGQVYECYDDGLNWKRQSCSPQYLTTYKDQPCISSCTASSTTSYFWCYTDSRKNWDYCGPTDFYTESELIAQYETYRGEACISKCDFSGTSYGWCRVPGNSWNYCSPNPGYDIYDAKCSDSCDYRGYSYMWCHLQTGSWGYCGSKSISTRTEYTYLESKCLTPCIGFKQLYGLALFALSDDTNTCYDATGRELPCSREPHLSTDNVQCISSCDTRGENLWNGPYTSCNTMFGNKYCSKVEDTVNDEGKSLFSLLRRWTRKKNIFRIQDIPLNKTRTDNLSNIYGLRDDQERNQVTFYERLERTANNAQYPIKGDSNMENWLSECLENWRRANYATSSQRSRTMAEAGNCRCNRVTGLRLDQQGRYCRNGIEYFNLQIQVNGLNRNNNNGRSTTVAEVQVPVDVAEENPDLVVNAFLTSAYQCHGVHIGRFTYNR